MTNKTIDATPAPARPHDHPDNHVMQWSESEPRWIAARDAKWAAALAQEKAEVLEEAAQMLLNGSFLHDQAPSKLFADAAAKAIRALKGAA